MHPYVARDVARAARTIRKLRKLLKGIRVGMLTTRTAAGDSRSRPMLVSDIDESGWVWFLTDRSSRKACELIQNPHASIACQSPRGDRYVSLQGTAVVVRDDIHVNRLWNSTYRSWFPKGKEDPELVLVAVRIVRAEYWLLPRSRVTRVLSTAKAMITGQRSNAGRHGILELQSQLA
jgi:general stress protein 26